MTEGNPRGDKAENRKEKDERGTRKAFNTRRKHIIRRDETHSRRGQRKEKKATRANSKKKRKCGWPGSMRGGR